MLLFVSLLLLYMCFKLKIACSQQSNASTECYLLFLDGSLMHYLFPTCLCWAQSHRRLAHEQASPPAWNYGLITIAQSGLAPVVQAVTMLCSGEQDIGEKHWKHYDESSPMTLITHRGLKKKRFKKKKKKQAHLPAFRKKITAHKRFFFFSVAASFLLWG